MWWLAISTVLIARLTDALHWRTRKNRPDYQPRAAIHRYVTGTYLTALLWCLYGVVILTQAHSIELASTIVVIGAMAGGGATILSAHKRTAMAYVFILLGPPSLCMVIASQDYRQFLGLLGLGFCAVMLVGAKYAAEFTAKAIELKNQNALLLEHMEEIVEERTQQIFSLSNIDPLSGLYNRAAFLKHLDRSLFSAQRHSAPLALLFIDLDGFKEVNDTIGHESGDKLLLQVAQRLRAYCNDSYTLCRWGGDEFLIALEDTTRDTALARAGDVIALISKPYDLEGNHLSIGATVGISLYPQHGDNASQLIQLADSAMYHQKRCATGNSRLFSDEISLQMQRRQKLKEGLSEAIERNQLHLHFQPIVCAKTGRLMTCEALLRWQFEDQAISPAEFIPIAEQYGLIQPIGAWVLQQACSQTSQWPDDNISVAVNVSVMQLQDKEFINLLDSVLEQSLLHPQRLHIEITESVFASDKSVLLKQIKALQARGIKVSIDDFGTEYSSLSVLQDLAVNIIKIDRSFVAKLDGNGLAIIKAVMHIALALNYKVVAEGVESREQADRLAELGVNYLQGFYFAKPIAGDKIADTISQWDS
ncbi:MAG: putative bifunctional diguanylate cyclase/phosphodiesterase [Pseudomonadales bacterium]